MRRWALLLIPMLASCSPPFGVEAVADRAFGAPKVLCRIADRRVNESSGIAPSLDTPGTWFTHNDSGDSPRFFRFDEKGAVLAVYDVANATAVDWEDMAVARVGGKSYVFLGDIGDNAGKRRHIAVYRVPEPSGPGRTVEADQVLTLSYPDEPHNAETLMVHPKTGDLYVVTKAATRPSMVFKLARPSRGGEYTLQKLGEVQLGGEFRESKLCTGGAISPDGRHVVLRTYLGAYEFDASGAFDQWFKDSPRSVRTLLDFQGEGITYAADGAAIVTSSEMSPCQIGLIPILGGR